MSDSSSEFSVQRVTPVARVEFLDIERLHLIGPGGQELDRVVVRHPGAVAVLPVLGDEVVLIRQYRAAVARNLLEVPAGKLDVPGEEVEAAAQRELGEEVGYRAGKMELMATFWVAPGFSDERMSVYLASELQEVPVQPHGAEEEVAEVVRVSIRDVAQMLKSDEFEDAKTIVALSALVARLGDCGH